MTGTHDTADQPTVLARGRSAWLPAAASSGVGSLPGTDIREATNIVFGETDLPYLPELPARGPGADMIGRTMARLAHVDPAFSITTTPSGWRLTDRPGRDVRRAMSMWGEDLDALEEHAESYSGPLKVSVCGPFTLAAAVELVSGEKMLRDAGARRDLGVALREATSILIDEVRRRVPSATLIIQIDEPSLPAVLSGAVSTASGLTALPPVQVMEVESVLADFVAGVHAHDVPVVIHSCAKPVPFDVWRKIGVDGWSFDTSFVDAASYDFLGQALDSGVALLLGAVPTTRQVQPDSVVSSVVRLQHELGFADDTWLPAIGVTPACGLATLTPATARAVIDTVSAAARTLRGAAVDAAPVSA